MMEDLFGDGQRVASLLMARRQTLALAEGSAGGLISAALLAVPGASAFYLGGAVVYTPRARHRLLGLEREAVAGMTSATEPFAAFIADHVRRQFRGDWGLAESGAAGPSGNPYGHAAGHVALGVAGAVPKTCVLETGSSERLANMIAFARAGLALLEEAILSDGGAAASD